MSNSKQKNRLQEIIHILQAEHSDNRKYEAKAAAKGFPATVVKTMSAFANTPGGGTLLFGIDENQDFAVVGVYDSKQCQQALAAYAKKEFTSSISFQSELIMYGNHPVVIVDILESEKSLKPVKVAKTGKAYIRMYDSDFELSPLEEQIFISNRGVARFDEDAVPGTSINDLNQDLCRFYIAERKRLSTVLNGMTDNEVLLRSGVISNSGELTVAGILALGIYPQQYFPNYSIQASVQKSSVLSDEVRAVNVRVFDGSIPVILENATKWVLDNSNELTKDIAGGMVAKINEYPPVSTRELIANALIHRDLNPLSMTQNISLTIEDKGLVISNPGGLYGISLAELGHTASVARNARLAEICQFVPTRGGAGIIEKLGSGIPKIYAECEKYGLDNPKFFDGDIYFTAILQSPIGATVKSGVRHVTRANNRDIVLSALLDAPLSRTEIAHKTGLTTSQVRYALNKLIEQNEVRLLGKNGDRGNRYIRLLDD
ncbi:MAG: putative DNA binding domain-containing protein [Clostridiales Family XIII bacterium]|jgi:ATP-dependent DNA helicase RecG|nr:putative DNA binding domain-containing protein [Clostridiales Family XIII bacterium]